VVRNDKTDPELKCAVDCTADESKGGVVAELAARAVDCPADESKGGAVAELAARNASNPSNGGRLAARAVASPLAPNYGSIGGAVVASAAAAVAVTTSFFFGGMRFVMVLLAIGHRQFLTEKTDVRALSVSDRHDAMLARNW
jgi:hypothetical protein